MEAQVNMHCCIIDGLDRGIVATIRCVLNQVNSFFQNVPASWQIYKKSKISQHLIDNSQSPRSQFSNTQSPNVTRRSPFYLTIWELKATLFCTSKVGDYSQLMIGSRHTIHCTSLCCCHMVNRSAFSISER